MDLMLLEEKKNNCVFQDYLLSLLTFELDFAQVIEENGNFMEEFVSYIQIKTFCHCTVCIVYGSS